MENPKDIQNMMTWFKSEKLKDEEREQKSKIDFIQEITQFDPNKIKNTPVVEKKYTLWERLKRTLGMN